MVPHDRRASVARHPASLAMNNTRLQVDLGKLGLALAKVRHTPPDFK